MIYGLTFIALAATLTVLLVRREVRLYRQAKERP